MYLDQTQEADFHLELVQSAKWKGEKKKEIKIKEKKRKEKSYSVYLPLLTTSPHKVNILPEEKEKTNKHL